MLEVNEGVVRPESVLEFFAGDEFAGMFEESGENLNGLRLKLEAGAVLGQFSGMKIDFKGAEADFLLLGDGHIAFPSVLQLQGVDVFGAGVAKDHDAVIGSEVEPAGKTKSKRGPSDSFESGDGFKLLAGDVNARNPVAA